MFRYIVKSSIDSMEFFALEVVKSDYGNYWIRFKNNRQRDDFIIKLFLRAIFYNNQQNVITISNNLAILKSEEITIEEVK